MAMAIVVGAILVAMVIAGICVWAEREIRRMKKE